MGKAGVAKRCVKDGEEIGLDLLSLMKCYRLRSGWV